MIYGSSFFVIGIEMTPYNCPVCSDPLIIVMLVAIFTVHLSNGFAAGDNGFEIPLYYGLMLLFLLSHGAGKISIDHLIRKNRDQK